MPRYVIERDVPGADKLSPADLQGLARESCTVLGQLGPAIQWLHGHVTGERIYCVYIAPGEDILREHARRGGFPATRIPRITAVIDPTTAE
jgi:hypothetical protein